MQTDTTSEKASAARIAHTPGEWRKGRRAATVSANNVARIGSEQIETNAALRDVPEPVGIGACLAHLRLALKPIPVEPEQEEKTV